MGNAPTKTLQKRGKKYVHWSNAERPSPPGKPQLVPGTPQNQPDVVTIRWTEPTQDGGAPITGYLVEHRRTGSPHWVRATPNLVTKPELTLSGLEPGWRYQFRVSAENDAGVSDPGELSEPLTVTLQRSAAAAPHFTQELQDTIVLENEKAEFCVHFRGTPTPKISWFKDGFEIFSSRRTKIVTESEVSTLVIFQAAFNDEGEIKCTATNRVGHVVTKTKLRLEAPPRIRLPRQYEDGLLFEMDEIIRLKVSVAGRPLPRVTWLHNHEPVVFGGRHEINNTERSSSLRVGEARREDRGEYQVRATSRLGEDVVSFLVTVTDRPIPPGKAKVVMTLGRSVTLSWVKPEDDGGCKIGNYIVEYYRIGWNVWLKAATCRQLTTTLGDLIEGSEYKFRVKAENPYGVSDPSEESEVVFIPDPKRGLLEAPARGSKPPEITPEQLKEDRKRRPIPSPDSSKIKREKHSDSSMEYQSSDADSVDVHSTLKRGDTRALTLQKVTPEPQGKKNVEKAHTLIPLTVVEHDSSKGESVPKRKLASGAESKRLGGTSPTTENKRRKEKENMERGREQLKPEVSPKAMKSSPKPAKSSPIEPEVKSAPAKPQSGSARDRDAGTSQSKDADYKGLAPEVYSLKIPVRKGVRLEDIEATKEMTQSKENGRIEHIMPREEDDTMMHGSSEMMLVLLPETRDDQAQTDRGRGGSFSRSFDEDNNLGVAPPMSLSAPELGCGDALEIPPLRNAISSTELLHEKTMARFFLEAAAEEVAQSIARRRSTDQRRDSFKAKDKLRPTSLTEKSPEKVENKFDRIQAEKDELLSLFKKHSPEVLRRYETKALTSGNVSKAAPLTDEEQEEADFARLRQRIAKSLEEDFKAVENEMRYMKKERLERNEDEEDEDEDKDKARDRDRDDEEEDEEDEEELGEEEEEEGLEEEEESIEEESIEESEEEDVDDEIEEEDEEPYHPTGKSDTKGFAKRSPPLRSMEPARASDEEDEPYHPCGMASRVVLVKDVPPPIPVHREVLTVRTINDSSKSSSPVRFEPKLDLQPKPILKTTSKFENDQGQNNSKSESTRASTPFGANEKKPKKQILNKILNKIEAPFKRSKTPPVDPKAADAVVRRKKKDQKPEEKGKLPAQEAVSQEGDVGLSAAEMARKRRLQTRQDSLEEDMEGSKILISLYSDIVKEYGAPRKGSPILLLNTEQLKAAAEGYTVDSDISISPEPIQEPFGQTNTYTKRDIQLEERKATPVKSELFKKLPPPPPPPETPTPPPPPSPEETQGSSQGYSEEEASEEELSEEVEEEVEKWEFTPRKMIARLRRSLTPKHSFRRQRSRVVNDEEVIKMAETRVHHFINYLTDLAMFLVACWLYLFKDERLAIPVLLLMVYRQMHEAIMAWVPQRWRRNN